MYIFDIFKNQKLGRIHISSTTAALLKRGQQHMLTPRGSSIEVKGKGIMQSFWLNGPSKLNSVLSKEKMAEHSGVCANLLYKLAAAEPDSLVNSIFRYENATGKKGALSKQRSQMNLPLIREGPEPIQRRASFVT